MMESLTRQEHIRAATNFLRNPNLDSPLKDKLQFLRDKGLSELEVEEAINLALSSKQSTSKGNWNFLFVFSMCILGYKFYKAYLEYQNTNQDKKTEQISSASSNIQSKCEIPDSEIVQKLAELRRVVEYQGSRLTEEIESLKRLSVSPENFPSAPQIPPWQLEDKTDKDK